MQGQVEVLAFPKTYARCQNMLEVDRAALIKGRLEIDEDRFRVIAENICPLDELLQRKADAVEVLLDATDLDDQLVEQLMGAVVAHRGEAQLFLHVARPGVYRLVALAGSSLRVTPSSRLTQDIEAVIGPDRVRYRERAEA